MTLIPYRTHPSPLILLPWSLTTPTSTPSNNTLILYQHLPPTGPASLGGIAVLLIASPVGAYGTKKVDDYQSALLKDKDDRISIVQEAIHGIRILKVCEICHD